MADFVAKTSLVLIIQSIFNLAPVLHYTPHPFFFKLSSLSGSIHRMCLSATGSHIFKERWFLSLENGIYCPVSIDNLFFQRSFKLNNSEVNLIPKPCPCNMASKFCSFLFWNSKQYAYLSVAQIKKKKNFSRVKNTVVLLWPTSRKQFLEDMGLEHETTVYVWMCEYETVCMCVYKTCHQNERLIAVD